MMRFTPLRLLVPVAVLFGLGILVVERSPVSSGASTVAFGISDTARASARAVANPAWGSRGVGQRYAFDGKCDDPRYAVTTGMAEPGSDEDDCGRFGGGLKK